MTPLQQIPGPTLVPDRIVRAMAQPIIDHRGPRFLAARRLDLSLGVGLGAVKGTVFRIGHLGGLNELDLPGGLAGVEMMLKELGVPVRLGAGLAAAEEFLTGP